ncbi:MAG TPA: tetratricopeptide repeat protein [Chthoniobacterales bacterium]
MKRPPRSVLVAGAALLLVLTGLIAFGIFWFQRDRKQTLALEKAETALKQNDFENAIALFDDALQLHLPAAKAASAYFDRAHAELEKGRYDDAIRDFSAETSIIPSRSILVRGLRKDGRSESRPNNPTPMRKQPAKKNYPSAAGFGKSILLNSFLGNRSALLRVPAARPGTCWGWLLPET